MAPACHPGVLQAEAEVQHRLEVGLGCILRPSVNVVSVPYDKVRVEELEATDHSVPRQEQRTLH